MHQRAVPAGRVFRGIWALNGKPLDVVSTCASARSARTPDRTNHHAGKSHLVAAQTTNTLTMSIRQNCENSISPGATKMVLNQSPSEWPHETDWRLLLLSGNDFDPRRRAGERRRQLH